jgi:hypothetical protein
MRAEFFTPKDRLFTTIGDLQDALDGWVAEYNTARPHQSCGGRPPAERFRLADRSLAADDTATAEPAPARAPVAGKRPAGVSRWVNAAGKISLAGFTYNVGATYAGEPVEVVVTGGLVDILHAGVVVATHAQRLREDHAGRNPRARVARRARDATAGLSVTRLANNTGVVTFADKTYAAGRRWAHASIDVTIVAGSVQLSKDGHVIRVHPIRHDRAKELGAFANPKGRPRRKNSATGNVALRSCRLGTGTHLSPRYRNLTPRQASGGIALAVIVPLVLDHDRGEGTADDQLCERVRDLAVGLQVGLDVLLHGERHVRVADPDAERLPVDLRIAARGGVAVARRPAPVRPAPCRAARPGGAAPRG